MNRNRMMRSPSCCDRVIICVGGLAKAREHISASKGGPVLLG